MPDSLKNYEDKERNTMSRFNFHLIWRNQFDLSFFGESLKTRSKTSQIDYFAFA